MDGPTVVRRQLAKRLRLAREKAGMRVVDVVHSKVMSKASLHRYEKGWSPATPAKVLELALLYRLDAATSQELYKLAFGSRERGWWEDADKIKATRFRFFLGLESAASEILTYQTDMVPGLLQTADYARAVQRASLPKEDERIVEGRVAVRLKRQQVMFARTPPIQIRAVLGAGVLATQVGGPQVMAEQTAHLRELAEDERVDLRVLPWSAGAHAAMAGGFILMRSEDPDDPPVVYAETTVGGSYFELPAQVAAYDGAFRDVHGRSIPMKEYQP
jgi:Domain of unknown function (DUF5753)/Helix-turn-helix domain